MTEVEQAENDRLKVENTYLFSRLVEMETKLNSSLDRLGSAVERLSKLVVPAQLPRLLTPEQAADVLGVTPEAVYKWISERKIPFRRAGRKPRFALDELMAWTVPTTDDKRSGDKRNADVLALRRS